MLLLAATHLPCASLLATSKGWALQQPLCGMQGALSLERHRYMVYIMSSFAVCFV